MSYLLVVTALRGYHVYMVMWEARVGDKLIALHENDNDKDRHAMAVYYDEDPGVVVGHLPREILKISYYFTRHNGKITRDVICSVY